MSASYQQFQQPFTPAGDRLPFAQINPNMEMRTSPDALLEQRIMERSMEAPSMNPNMNVGPGGTNPMMQQIQQHQSGPYNTPVAGEINIHPAVIKQFTEMNPTEQARVAQTNPQFVQQIYHTMQRMAQQQQEQHMQGVRPQQPGPAGSTDPGHDTDSESISTASVLSSELENSHSSDEGSEHDEHKEGERKKKHRKKKNAPTSTNEGEPKFNFSGESGKSGKSNSGSKSARKKNKHRHRDRDRDRRELVVERDTDLVKDKNRARDQSRGVKTNYVSLDFRKDLIDIEGDHYILGFPTQHNVYQLELESCVINRNQILDREPYIYISVGEVDGDYNMTDSNVFGKLIQERTVNEFIMYRPENCVKTFKRPTRFNKLTISFSKYDLGTISINELHVKHLGKLRPKSGSDADYIKITTKSAHHLDVGDTVNISSAHNDRQTVDSVEVVEVVSDNAVILDSPVTTLGHDMRLQFEKVNLKCTLTFKMKTARV